MSAVLAFGLFISSTSCRRSLALIDMTDAHQFKMSIPDFSVSRDSQKATSSKNHILAHKTLSSWPLFTISATPTHHGSRVYIPKITSEHLTALLSGLWVRWDSIWRGDLIPLPGAPRQVWVQVNPQRLLSGQ